jgi:SAM-dependent methyltransferase
MGHGSEDVWGALLLDHLNGADPRPAMLEAADGASGPAMPAEWFFRSFEGWDWWDQELLAGVERGPVLDLGCGAGRASLYLQQRGLEVTAVDHSAGAVEVSRRRGVLDARLADLNDPPSDRLWATVLLLNGNLGLGGSWDGNRRLLRRLADVSAPGATLIGDSVDYTGPGEIRLRIRSGEGVTPWWQQRNVSHEEIPRLVRGTGWVVEQQLMDGTDHAVRLLRADL